MRAGFHVGLVALTSQLGSSWLRKLMPELPLAGQLERGPQVEVGRLAAAPEEVGGGGRAAFAVVTCR